MPTDDNGFDALVSELTETFVAELPDRIASIEWAIDKQDLARLAHPLTRSFFVHRQPAWKARSSLIIASAVRTLRGPEASVRARWAVVC